MTKRARGLIMAVAVLATTAVFTAPSGAVPGDVPPDSTAGGQGSGGHDVGGQDCVKTLQPTREKAMRPDGTTQDAQPNDGMARSYEYADMGPGAHEVVPPPGWRPLTATDQALESYGFPPRPADPVALGRWQSQMANWKTAGEPRMCQTNRRNGLTNDRAESHNWDGGMLVNGSATQNTFYDALGEFYQTAFDAVCPAASGYSTWTGLGGWPSNSGRLIQAGTAAAQAGLNTIYMFWEMLSDTFDTTEMDWMDRAVKPGDDVDSYVSHHPGSSYMWVYDITQGFTHAMQVNGSIYGQAADSFYDGTTAEYITEDPQMPSGAYYYLRKPHLGNTYFPYAVANGFTPIANFWSWNIHQRLPNGHLLQGSYFDGVHAWTDPWYACG